MNMPTLKLNENNYLFLITFVGVWWENNAPNVAYRRYSHKAFKEIYVWERFESSCIHKRVNNI